MSTILNLCIGSLLFCLSIAVCFAVAIFIKSFINAIAANKLEAVRTSRIQRLISITGKSFDECSSAYDSMHKFDEQLKSLIPSTSAENSVQS